MQLDVAAGKKARGYDDGAFAGGRVGEFKSEPVNAGARLAVVFGPGAKLNARIVWWRKVGSRGSANVAFARAGEGLKIAVNADAVYVEASEETGGVMVHKVHVAVEAAVFAASDEAEVCVVAAVGEDKSAASGEVARGRNDVRECRGALKSERSHQERAHEKARDCDVFDLFECVVHWSLSVCAFATSRGLGNPRGGGGDHDVCNTSDGDVQSVDDGAARRRDALLVDDDLAARNGDDLVGRARDVNGDSIDCEIAEDGTAAPGSPEHLGSLRHHQVCGNANTRDSHVEVG